MPVMTLSGIPTVENGRLPVDAALFAFDGTTVAGVQIASLFREATVSALGDNAIWTPAAGKRVRLLGGLIQCGAVATDVQLSDALAPRSPVFKLTPNQILDLSALFRRSNGLLLPVNNVLNLNLSAANPVAVWLCGCEE